MKKLSIVIPVFNEQDNIPKIYSELDSVLKNELKELQAEILFTDNCSTDLTPAVVTTLAARDPRIRLIRLSRNFGYQASILTGYLACKGDAAIQLDADGEDDPKLLPEFIRRWKEGYWVVYGVRRTRQESWIKRIQRSIFYRILRSLSNIPIPVDAGDFRLVDRRVIEVLRGFGEANPYLRGLIAYSGFRQIGIEYDRRARFSGESKFSWWDYFRLALDGITSFSRKPLALATLLGFALASVSLLGVLFYLYLYFFVGIRAAGFTTLVIVVLFTTAIQLICTGISGAYIGRIFEEVKARPKAIIDYELADGTVRTDGGLPP